MTTPLTVVLVGAGSAVFGLAFLQDFFQAPDFRGARLRLVDTDEVALERMRRLAERLDAKAGWDVTVTATTSLEAGLQGAGFVVTSVAVDRAATWAADHEMALRHGFPSVLSENGGPGGLSHTLRSVPLMMGIADAIERIAPGALMLNYANPENRVCMAINRYTSVRVVGLCHGVAGTIEWAAGLLGCTQGSLDLQVAGVNHFTWITSLTERSTGEDLLPAFRRAVDRQAPDVWPLCRFADRTLGSFPTTGDGHVGEYLPWAAAMIGTDGYDFAAYVRRATDTADQIERWGRGDDPIDGLLTEPSSEAKVNHAAALLIADIVARRDGYRPSFILPNAGLVPGLGEDATVEVAGIVEAGELRGRPVGPLPVPVRALVEGELAIQRLAVEAAVTGSRQLALQALLIDPLVASATAAEAFLEDVLQRHRAYLPRFWADDESQVSPTGGCGPSGTR